MSRLVFDIWSMFWHWTRTWIFENFLSFQVTVLQSISFWISMQFRVVTDCFCTLLWIILDQIVIIVDSFGDFKTCIIKNGNEKYLCLVDKVLQVGLTCASQSCRQESPLEWSKSGGEEEGRGGEGERRRRRGWEEEGRERGSFRTKLHLQKWPPCPVRLPALLSYN